MIRTISQAARSHAAKNRSHRVDAEAVTVGAATSCNHNLRFGLCCQFKDQPIRFHTTTAASLLRMPSKQRRIKLATLCLSNAEALLAALRYCAEHRIGCFRILSQVLPAKTHPDVGYEVGDLPGCDAIVAAFRRCGKYAAEHGIRTVFHPDQFVVLNSPRADVVRKSVVELEYHAEVAGWVGADVINIHAGGGYGNKASALATLERNLDQLPEPVRSRLTLENDDLTYSPNDLLQLCRRSGVPLVYDVHHHRCHPDGLDTEQATEASIQTWNREPLFHISSPLQGWNGPQPKRHHDYVDPTDFPACWQGRRITIEVEAKAKELAVLHLKGALIPPTDKAYPLN